jgi:Tol biopolymer transport system component
MLAHYGAGGDGQQTLFLRTLASGEVRPVQGSSAFTAPAESLFWSPDSRQLVRGTNTEALIVDAATGASRPLCDCRFVGGSWNHDGVILIGSFANARGAIRRVSISDRTPVAVTTVDAAKGEQDSWPLFLPDGRQFLFTRMTPGAGAVTYVGSLDGGTPTRLLDGSWRTFVRTADGRNAFLLGIEPAGLAARTFDPNTLSVTGAPVTVVAGAAAASASENGILATSAAGSRPRTIPTWFDRNGAVLGSVGEASLIEGIALSFDGRKLAESAHEPNRPRGEGNDIWVRDTGSDARTRLTFGPNSNSTPLWSPDGSRIVFSSQRNGLSLPHARAADGTGPEVPLFVWDRQAFANDWSSDGRWVIYSTLKSGSTTDNDLWVVAMDDAKDRKPFAYLAGPAKEQQAQFSPDGRFIAYGSDQSGAWEIYVQPFPNASEGKWMVSSGGGVEPRWSRDGKELFYFAGQRLMSVAITLRPTFSSGPRKALFDAPVQTGYTNDSHRWQVAPDGKRFLLLTNAGKDQAPPLDIVVNWMALLKK